MLQPEETPDDLRRVQLRRICRKKDRYEDFYTAVKVAQQMDRSPYFAETWKLNPFQCKVCGGWHIGRWGVI